MIDQLTPKTINIQLPGYYGVFYLDAGLQAAIRTLETSAQVMHDAGNDQAYYGLIDAITAFKAAQIAVNEVKAENNQELMALQGSADQNEGVMPQFGMVVDDDPDPDTIGPMDGS